MGLKENLMNQCRNPKRIFGKFMVKSMNKHHSDMADWGTSHISIKSDYYILDIGCGGGKNINNFAKQINEGKIFGIDYSDVSVEVSKKINQKFIESGQVEIKKASVSSLPFPENFFDLVTGFETYYFWPDLLNDLKGIYGILKPGGRLVLINEAFKCKNDKIRKRNEKWANIGNFPIHAPQEIERFLENAGFMNPRIEIEEQERYIIAIGTK
jgi:ubiquinone/menaquinone biosynthesis C-methylase UbiE